MNNREVGAWIDLIIGAKTTQEGDMDPINKAWVAVEIKRSTTTVVNNFVRNHRKRRQLTSTLNYAAKHTYPKTAVIFVGMYSQRFNRNTFRVYERRMQMMAVRRGGFAYVDIVTDFGRSKRRR